MLTDEFDLLIRLRRELGFVLDTVLEFDTTKHSSGDRPSPPHRPSRARKVRIAILDNANGAGNQLKPDLIQSGFEVRSIPDGDRLYQLMDQEGCDLVLIAANMRRVSAHDLILDIRRRCSAGIVMVADTADISDRIFAFEFGADEFLCTPFEQREAIARIRSLSRRLNMSATTRSSGFGFLGLRLDLVTRRLLSDRGEELRLTSREFEVLALLLEHANQPVRREQIQGSAHSYHDSRAADALIGRIRKKLREAGIREEDIRPIRSVGYVLAANVSRD